MADFLVTGESTPCTPNVANFDNRTEISLPSCAETASLTRALMIAYARGRPVYVRGDYTMTNVSVPSNSKLIIDGHISSAAGMVDGAMLSASCVENAWIEGGQISSPVQLGIYNAVDCIRGTLSKGLTIKNVIMPTAGTFGVQLNGCTQSRVEDVEVGEAGVINVFVRADAGPSELNKLIRVRALNARGSHGIQVAGGKRNIIDDSYSFGAYNFGLSLYKEEYSSIINSHSDRSRVEGAQLSECFFSSILNTAVTWEGAGGHDSEDFGISVNGDPSSANFNIISGNKINGCAKSGIALADTCEYTLVSGNHIYDVNSLNEAWGSGVLLYGTTPTTKPVNNQVTNNQIFGDGVHMKYGVRDESGLRNLFGPNNIMNTVTAPTSYNALSVITGGG